ncbi:GntR family transcriptional regulator [Phycisphaera mikurensis]|uniref:Putative GntR family transcriptional regulator n=1 Tax=Phycisphaera mikurensis (strain NBRC 102666 / KCTC 22515 / FYK2301M01) TaxID=1142394 RepID=I0IFC7_PHYMF|nr:GntR family transcriptional regulator [Phycisphaera mikurensis]MBB6440642.1 GntR family transcriptional regulator of arabinose operon [Phycisphaera mikurensis]BAM03965.1 putative GntR family transcriptional regulator [Phycisphaera mikurensis NBRC 102666]
MYEDLLRELRAGGLRPGDQLPTEQELSDRYGFHRNTVRQAVKRLTINGLVEKRKPRGVFVRPGVAADRVGDRLCLIYGPEDTTQATAFVHDGIAAARAHGLDPRIIRMMVGDEHIAVAAIEGGERALVIGAHFDPLDEVRQAMTRARGRVASLGVRLEQTGVPSVVCDDERGINLCVAHLREHGHRRIGLVVLDGEFGSATLENEIRVWGEAIGLGRGEAAGSPDLLRVRRSPEVPVEVTGYHEMLARFRSEPAGPTGWLVIGEELAYAAAGAAARAGIRVPQELSLIAYGGTGRSEVQPLRMTALDCGIREHVNAALRLIGVGKAAEPVGEKPPDDALLGVIQPVLHERDSVAAAAR